ncbi:hypothetical protein, partial [Moorena sp. SIO3H5]|uniref:hypothetical protein n=1 Tax=Moorena sp. SIO3H5 TaxID=2607834 RepID=UPI0013BD429B
MNITLSHLFPKKLPREEDFEHPHADMGGFDQTGYMEACENAPLDPMDFLTWCNWHHDNFSSHENELFLKTHGVSRYFSMRPFQSHIVTKDMFGVRPKKEDFQDDFFDGKGTDELSFTQANYRFNSKVVF